MSEKQVTNEVAAQPAGLPATGCSGRCRCCLVLIDFLRTLEWSGTTVNPSGYHTYACPSCKGNISRGHAPDCTLNAIISLNS